MIPKKIHYCWFGDGEKPELVQKCIASWKRHCPDCEIIEWNTSNYDVTKNTYMNEAFQAGRWSFVSDYARLDILYEHGGVYLDTDVELIRPIDELLNGNGFIGFEIPVDAGYTVNTGQGFGAKPHDEVIGAMLNAYDSLRFIHEDGTQNLQPCPYYNTKALVDMGLQLNNSMQQIADITVYPTEYFCPVNWKSKKCMITKNTFSIHHFNASWLTDKEKKKRRRTRRMDQIIHFPNRVIRAVVGKTRYEKMKSKFGR